jgi:RHS repeat-associated protein
LRTTARANNRHGVRGWLSLLQARVQILKILHFARSFRRVDASNTSGDTYPDDAVGDRGYVEFLVDAAMRLTKKTDQEAQDTVYVLDSMGRATAITKGTEVDSFTYKPWGALATAQRGTSSGGGNPDAVSAVTRSYDGLNRVTREAQSIRETTARNVDYVYDKASNVLTLTYPNGIKIETTFDPRNRANLVGRDGSQLADYDYVGHRESRLIYETGANDVTYAPGYDGMGRVTRMPWDRNGTLIAGFNYTFDKASNITQKVLDHRASDPSEDYTIDGLYRLTNALYSQRSLTHGFTYDDLGNRLTYDNNANQTTYLFNAANELTKLNSTQVYYDKNGNLTKDSSGGGGGPYVFYYDRQNQLTRIEDSSAAAVASYAYDALGRRIEKIDHKANGGSGETLHFHYDGQRVVRDRTSDGSLVRQYLWGNYIDELLLLRDNDGTEYVFARDHLYSPVAAIAKADGTITERYEYDAYGKPYILDADYTVDGSSDIANPYLFTGRQLDTLDSGAFLIQYSRARYYDYETGRWYQRDPLNQDIPGGGYHDGMGLYEYVGSRPVDDHDSTGTLFGMKRDKSAKNIIKKHNPSSQAIRREYCGLVCQYDNDKGKYVNTTTIGTESGCTPDNAPCPQCTTRVAAWHTHPFVDNDGDGLNDYDSEHFSPADRNYSNRIRVPLYLGTPSGKIKKIKPH